MVTSTTATQRQLLFDDVDPPGVPGPPPGRMSPGCLLMRSMLGRPGPITLPGHGQSGYAAPAPVRPPRMPGADRGVAHLRLCRASRSGWTTARCRLAISGHSAPATPRRLRAPQGWTQVDRRVTHRPDFEPPATLVS